ncbi:alcohol dehydrogenase catalytic domain-containing protein [Mycolicibacterium sp. 624]|uniref:alcohol dehydrogenase catalytic domain-containing protein n=1 Tax=Mycolicibacterium sp. 624 TaxID=3156314 RepID=UPI0033957059
MRAAVLEQFTDPLNVTSLPDPSPRQGQVVIRVRAAGVCRTDIKIIDGGVPSVSTPRIIGHEPAGEVVALGADVTEASIGDRVFVSPDVTCGQCAYCRDGMYNYCAQLRRLGFELDGALAEYMVAPVTSLIPLSEEISYEVGATLPDAVGASYHAVVSRAQVRPAETVVINGLGGLGLCAVQIAALCGARVIAVARNAERRLLAEKLGAARTLDPREDLIGQLTSLTSGLGVHSFLDFVGTSDSLDQAVRACRKGGRVVIVGYIAPELRTAPVDLVYREVSIVGSRSSTHAELAAAARLVAEGRITPLIGQTRELVDVNDAIALLRAGSVIGRIVVSP